MGRGRVEVGAHVRINEPGAWYHGLTGVVLGGLDKLTVQPDDEREPNALVRL